MLALITRCGIFAVCLSTFACDSPSPSNTDEQSTGPDAQTSASAHTSETDGGSNGSAHVDASGEGRTSTQSRDTDPSTSTSEGEPSTSRESAPSTLSDAGVSSHLVDTSIPISDLDGSTVSTVTSTTTAQPTSAESTASTASSPDSSATTDPNVGATSTEPPVSSEADGGQQSADGGTPVVRQVITVPAPGTPITAPAGCAVEVLTESAEGCEYLITCESGQISSRVDPTGAEWSMCGSGLTTDRFYRFSGIEGIEACTFATNFCLRLPDTLESAAVCEVDVDDTPDGTCQYINECTQPLDLGHGVTADVRSSWTMLSCYPAQTGGEGCGCSGDSLDSRSWHVDAPTGTNPCELTRSICFDDEPLDIGRAEGTSGVCETEPSFASDIQCQLEEHCTFAKPYGDATTLSVTEIDTGDCTNFDGDEWTCECDASGGHFLRLRLTGDPGSDVACGNALDVCRQPTLEGNGPLSCSQVLSTEEDECQIDFECEQPIIAGTQDVIRNAYGYTWCYTGQDGWQCECRYDQTGEEFVLDASLSPGQACSQAFAACTPKFEL